MLDIPERSKLSDEEYAFNTDYLKSEVSHSLKKRSEGK